MSHPASSYRPALAFQLTHVALCVVWNGVGLLQKSRGEPTIGPTASFAAILVVILLGLGLVMLLRKARETPYLCLSALALLLAVPAIYGGLTKDASNWPSEFWRWAGIAVNSVGVIGFLLALAIYARRRSSPL